MASSNQTPDVLFSPIAANADASDINTIPQTYDPANYGYAAQNVGFPTECRLPVLNPDGTLGQGRAPRMQDWNGIMKLVSSHNFFLQNGGSYTFNPTVSSNIGGYPKNAVLWYFPENEAPCIVYSLINDNTNNFVDDPTLIDGIHWEMLVNPSSYANIALTNSPYTTNRILEIPQDVKLELNNGTLTLKAGSKVYDGNSNSFSITSDITKSGLAGGDVQQLLLLKIDGTTLMSVDVADTDFAYNSSTGYVHSNTYGDYYLPIALTSHNTGTGVYTSIDQIFNGFGYIGSTVFVFPMKGQATTAINIDGTVTSTIWETTTVQTLTLSSSGSVSMSSTGVLTFGFNEVGYTKLADVTYYSSRIQGVDFYGVSFVANSNASNFSQAGRSYLSGLGMPSNRYIDLTLLASGGTYTAPANGWFNAITSMSSTGVNTGLLAMNLTTGVYAGDQSEGAGYHANSFLLPVRKGDVMQFYYYNYTAMSYFRFYYAEGEN